MDEKAEILRIGYKYRKILRSGIIKIPHKDAEKLIGPDCAYHLYRNESTFREKNSTDKT